MANLIASIHVAKRDLDLDDDTYRTKLANITGKSSVKDMTEAERRHVLEMFRSAGFKQKAGRRSDGRLKLSGKYAAKLQALWIAGWNLGVVRNRDDAGLEEFVRGRTGLEAVRFCHDPNDARKAIEALKAMLSRAGVDWTTDKARVEYTQKDGYRVARAQANLLEVHYGDFWTTVWAVPAVTQRTFELSKREWIAVMNAFGKRIRAEKKAAAI